MNWTNAFFQKMRSIGKKVKILMIFQCGVSSDDHEIGQKRGHSSMYGYVTTVKNTFIATQDINSTNATFVRKVIHMSSHWKKTLPVHRGACSGVGCWVKYCLRSAGRSRLPSFCEQTRRGKRDIKTHTNTHTNMHTHTHTLF